MSLWQIFFIIFGDLKFLVDLAILINLPSLFFGPIMNRQIFVTRKAIAMCVTTISFTSSTTIFNYHSYPHRCTHH